MSEETEILERIEARISQLVILTKLMNSKALDEARHELQSDKDYMKILEVCGEPTSFNNILSRVSADTGVSRRTVQSKLSHLKSKGVLLSSRRGREVYYFDSGLLD